MSLNTKGPYVVHRLHDLILESKDAVLFYVNRYTIIVESIVLRTALENNPVCTKITLDYTHKEMLTWLLSFHRTTDHLVCIINEDDYPLLLKMYIQYDMPQLTDMLCDKIRGLRSVTPAMVDVIFMVGIQSLKTYIFDLMIIGALQPCDIQAIPFSEMVREYVRVRSGRVIHDSPSSIVREPDVGDDASLDHHWRV